MLFQVFRGSFLILLFEKSRQEKLQERKEGESFQCGGRIGELKSTMAQVQLLGASSLFLEHVVDFLLNERSLFLIGLGAVYGY